MAKETFVLDGENFTPLDVMIDNLEEVMPEDLSRKDLKKYISENYETVDLWVEDDFNEF